MSWLPFSILATLCIGISSALYKLPTLKGHNRAASVVWIAVSAGVLSLIFFHAEAAAPNARSLFLAFIWGTSFAGLIGVQMSLLKHMDTNIHFPINTTLSLILTLAVGLFFFTENLSSLQFFGLVLAVTAICAFVYHHGLTKFSTRILWISAATASLSAFAKIIQKVAVSGGADIRTFQVYQYLFCFIAASVVYLLSEKGDLKELFSPAALWGLVNGIFTFFGGWAILIALSKGPFPLVTAIHSMYIFVTAFVGWLFLKEKLTSVKIGLIGMSIAAIVLMRLG